MKSSATLPGMRVANPQEILDFWFGGDGPADFAVDRRVWFERNEAFDTRIRERFMGDYVDAASGLREDWQRDPHACLAYILILDQFPRNLFRGDRRAWATDQKARDATERAMARGFDAKLAPNGRKFLYMPYMHSETISDQRRAALLFQNLGDEASISAALRHLEIVERFGRFPHRNAILGRRSSPEEEAFLLEPNSSF